MTQQDVSIELGIARTTVTALEKGNEESSQVKSLTLPDCMVGKSMTW